MTTFCNAVYESCLSTGLGHRSADRDFFEGLPIKYIKFLFASLKTLTNSKNKLHRISILAFVLTHWLIFSSVLNGRLSEKVLGPQAAFRNNFQIHRGPSDSYNNLLDKFTEPIFTISMLFHRRKHKFYFGCSSPKDNKKL
jgi:hypothetical protein